MDTGSLRPPDNQSNSQPSPFHSRQLQTSDGPQQSFPTGPFQSWQPQTPDTPPQQSPFQPFQQKQFRPLFHPVEQPFQSDQSQAWDNDNPTQPLPIPPITSQHLPLREPSPSGKKSLSKWTYVCISVLLLLLILIFGYGISHVLLLRKAPASTSPAVHSTTVVQKKSHAQSTQPSSTTVTRGTPHVGGPISDFVSKYGQPVSQGIENGQNFFGDTSHTIDINARTDNEHQQVTYLAVVGPQSWSESQTKAYCTQFLPSDAQQSNSTADLTNYQSSIGKVVLTMNGVNMCMLNIVGA